MTKKCHTEYSSLFPAGLALDSLLPSFPQRDPLLPMDMFDVLCVRKSGDSIHLTYLFPGIEPCNSVLVFTPVGRAAISRMTKKAPGGKELSSIGVFLCSRHDIWQ